MLFNAGDVFKSRNEMLEIIAVDYPIVTFKYNGELQKDVEQALCICLLNSKMRKVNL